MIGNEGGCRGRVTKRNIYSRREKSSMLTAQFEKKFRIVSLMLLISLMLEYGVSKSRGGLPLRDLSHVHIPLHVSVRRLTVHECFLFSGR